MRTKLTAIAVLAVAAVILASIAAAGLVAAQQQVAIQADRCDITATACWPALTPLAAVRSAPAERGLVSAFAFDTRAPDTVYAATIGSRAQGRVYKTIGGGHRWHSTTTRPLSTRVDALAADPRHPATLYAGTGVAVFKTMNGGRSWRGWNRGLLSPPPIIAPGQVTGTPGYRRLEGYVTALAVDPTDSNVVYAGTGGGVRKSTDGAHSWRTVLWHGRYMGISALVIAPTSPQVVYAAAFVDEPANCGPPGRTALPAEHAAVQVGGRRQDMATQSVLGVHRIQTGTPPCWQSILSNPRRCTGPQDAPSSRAPTLAAVGRPHTTYQETSPRSRSTHSGREPSTPACGQAASTRRRTGASRGARPSICLSPRSRSTPHVRRRSTPEWPSANAESSRAPIAAEPGLSRAKSPPTITRPSCAPRDDEWTPGGDERIVQAKRKERT